MAGWGLVGGGGGVGALGGGEGMCCAEIERLSQRNTAASRRRNDLKCNQRGALSVYQLCNWDLTRTSPVWSVSPLLAVCVFTPIIKKEKKRKGKIKCDVHFDTTFECVMASNSADVYVFIGGPTFCSFWKQKVCEDIHCDTGPKHVIYLNKKIKASKIHILSIVFHLWEKETWEHLNMQD